MTTDRALSPSAVAKRYGISADKVLAWIHSGELSAVNVAQSRSGRPRWRITPEAIEQFERSRANTPPPKRTRRRRRGACKSYV